MLDFLWEPCYCITVREENKAEFHSHLSAFRKRLGFILHSYAGWYCVYVSIGECGFMSALFFMFHLESIAFSSVSEGDGKSLVYHLSGMEVHYN